MDYLRKTILSITQQLDVLNRSQKIAIGLCGALVAFSLVWLVNYSAAPEMEPLLRQSMTLDEISNALATLKLNKIDAKQVGDRVFVRAANRDRAMLALNEADALPTDISIGFSELMNDENPFRPADENKWRRQVALGTELGRIIATRDDVKSARVVIQDRAKRRIGAQGGVHPTASVQIKMASGKLLDRRMVDGIGRFVAGAVSGLAAHHVTVVDASTGRAFQTPDPDDILGMGLLEEKKNNEKHFIGKIRESLQSIPGVLVSVSVELDAQRTKTQTQAWTPPAVQSEDSSSQVTNSASGAGETGVNPNVGVAINANPAGSRNETEQSHTDFYEPKSSKIESVEKVPFNVLRATASIGIPRSFLVGIYQARYGEDVKNADLDDDANFQQISRAEIDRVRQKVATILMAKTDEDVDVGVFYDFAPQGTEFNSFSGSGEMVASADGGMASYARRYGVQGVLMGLALVSFFTMARMVRKSSEVVKAVLPPERTALLDDDSEESLHVAEGGPVGKAEAGASMLVGQEIDENSLRFRELNEQVTEMVTTDPKMAADLLKRWADSDE